MKLRMDNFWNTLVIVGIATVIVNLLAQLIIDGGINIGSSLGLGIVAGAAVGALVKFKKLSFS